MFWYFKDTKKSFQIKTNPNIFLHKTWSLSNIVFEKLNKCVFINARTISSPLLPTLFAIYPTSRISVLPLCICWLIKLSFIRTETGPHFFSVYSPNSVWYLTPKRHLISLCWTNKWVYIYVLVYNNQWSMKYFYHSWSSKKNRNQYLKWRDIIIMNWLHNWQKICKAN